MTMDRNQLVTFLRKHRWCVQASVSSVGAPQAAVVGYAVSDELEIIFDTSASTRKARNLRADARVALVVGWDNEQTLQVEGLADEPEGRALARLKQHYFAAFPDGVERERWPDITYLRVRPHWARFSDFRAGSAAIVELHGAALTSTRPSLE
jgi:general stress protein 26